jgi:hypothetical protein
VDAALDTTFIANIANYFGKALNCKLTGSETSTSDQATEEQPYMRYSRWLFSWRVSGGVRDQAVQNPLGRVDRVVVCSSPNHSLKHWDASSLKPWKQTNFDLQQL